MSDPLNTARRLLLEPGGLDEAELARHLDALLAQGGMDYADLYFQRIRSESWFLEDGHVKEGGFNIDQGVGVRAVSGEKSALAYADEIAPAPLAEAVDAVRAIARQGQSGTAQAWRRTTVPHLYPATDPLASLGAEEKIALLQAVDAEARAQDPRITQVIASLAGTWEVCLVAASDGTLAADVRPLVRLSVSVVAERDGRREQGSAGGGGRDDYHIFLADNRARAAFSGRIGERVASELCTVVDDGTLPGRRGSLNVDDLNVDDEGTPSQRTVLIENGILKGYMQDKLNARLSGAVPTGNGRRESFAHLPMPRMTNTYLLPGPHSPEEIIASVDYGLYAVNFGGGQVDITSGKFVFSASEAYLIEKGRVTRPVKGATLIGNGPDVLTRVTMVGNDLALDEGVGTCGKEGQSVPVGVGQPTLRVDGLTVGGTETG